MFTAKTIMTKDVITAKPSTPIWEAVDLIIKNNITGLPVVDKNMHILGILSEKDILILLNQPEMGVKSVAEVMTKDVLYCEENDHIVDVNDILINKNFRRIPIVSDGKLIGIVSRRDIIKFIAKIKKPKN